MINRVVPDAELIDAALAIAQKLASGPTFSFGLVRELVWSGCEEPFESQLWKERQAQKLAGRSGDFDEGIAAFREKRVPAFKGKP